MNILVLICKIFLSLWKCICLNWNINLRSSRASIKWSIGSLGRSIFHIFRVYFYNRENVFFQIGRLIWERSSRASMKWSIWSLDRMRNDLLKTFNPLFDRFKFHINKHDILRFQWTSTSRKCPPWHQLRKLITKKYALDKGHGSLLSVLLLSQKLRDQEMTFIYEKMLTFN